jgi:hypothetical protein
MRKVRFAVPLDPRDTSQPLAMPACSGVHPSTSCRRVIRTAALCVFRAMSDGADSSPIREARRSQAALVNFGVAAVARTCGVPEAQPLELRCECGNPGCRERIRIARREYELASAAGVLIVSPAHVSSEIVEGYPTRSGPPSSDGVR